MTCSECGKTFLDSELISYQGFKICADCKPRFMQKIKEGLNVAGQFSYGGFWVRFAAVFLDGLILYVINLPLSLLAGLAGGGVKPGGFGPAQVLTMALSFVLGATYEALMIGKYQATLGKRAMGLRVLGEDGGRISYGRATGRYFAKLINYFTLGIGFLMVIWDPRKQGLHDRICNTLVVKA
jgi:uncharacterized RDD family membrane protein YckC